MRMYLHMLLTWLLVIGKPAWELPPAIEVAPFIADN